MQTMQHFCIKSRKVKGNKQVCSNSLCTYTLTCLLTFPPDLSSVGRSNTAGKNYEFVYSRSFSASISAAILKLWPPSVRTRTKDTPDPTNKSDVKSRIWHKRLLVSKFWQVFHIFLFKSRVFRPKWPRVRNTLVIPTEVSDVWLWR